MWLVCKNKETGDLIIQTREERETQNSVLIDLNIIVPSIVLRTFDNYNDAYDFKKRVEDAGDIISDIL